MCLHVHQKYGFGQERKINLWLRVGTGDFQEIIGRESADLASPWHARNVRPDVQTDEQNSRQCVIRRRFRPGKRPGLK